MKSSHIIFFILSSLFVTISCQDNTDSTLAPYCDEEVIISKSEYQSATTDGVTILDLAIEGDCLSVSYGASGCSGDSWKLKLIDASEIMESLPPQRNLVLSLDNNEACAAYFTKEVTFDISALQVGEGEVRLNITNTNEEILYSY